MTQFKIGDTVAFDSMVIHSSLTIDQKKRYYGHLYDFDKNKPYLFTFLCYHSPQVGHCVLINMHNQRVETMLHPEDFRLVDNEEC